MARTRVNLITGFLGVGKTTAIRSVLEKRPEQERWAVLVNELGAVGIDQTTFEEGDAVTIREVAGGCLCCTAGVPFNVALTELLRRTRPDRLLIEPTGAGHPARVLDTLRGEHLGNALDTRATVCLVDPRHLDDPDISNSAVFRDQVHLADVLVANKTDLAGPEATAAFHQWAKGLFPPKALVAETHHGELNLAWLDTPVEALRTPLFADAHTHAPGERHAHPATPQPGIPVRLDTTLEEHSACGWLFSAEEVFDYGCVEALLQEIPAGRVKGVFHTNRGWYLFNGTSDRIEAQSIAYRRDSRLEIIHRAETDCDDIDTRLRACLVSIS